MGHRTSSVARAIWPIDGTIVAVGRSKNLGGSSRLFNEEGFVYILAKIWRVGNCPLELPGSDGPVLLWPMYVFSWMHAVMHEKRFALHGHKSTDGLNVEEEMLGKTTLL